MNVAYGSDPLQKMDLYLPANRTDSTKVLFLIHGGAWTGGDKIDFNTAVAAFKQRLPEYAIVNINYRLARQGADYFPSQENDVRSAIDFVFEKRNDYSISEDFVLLGASAGAHLALLHAYKYTSPVKINAVISFFGPTDLKALYSRQTNSYYKSLFALLVGGTPEANAEAYRQSSPISFVTPQSPPTLLLHGGKDFMVGASQSQILKTKLDAAGVDTQLFLYPNEGHGWFGANLDDSFEKIFTFLEMQVQ
jgi:acetyl esterase/lipase